MDSAVTTGRTWFCQWDASPVAIRGYHSGDGWYRRTVRVPAEWKGRRVWLKTGWVNSMGWFWVNGEQVALEWNYCATHKYDITDLVKFGEDNMVVVQVNNEAPSHRGCMNSKNHWGGILRDLELEATPQVFIDDSWVRGDYDGRQAEAHVMVGGEVKAGKVRVTVDVRKSAAGFVFHLVNFDPTHAVKGATIVLEDGHVLAVPELAEYALVQSR